MPIKCDECMKRTAELELCHLAVPREGSGKKNKAGFFFCFLKKKRGEILILHAPHHVVNILLRCILFFFDSLYDSLSAAK